MPRYRRQFAGPTYFFTVVVYRRRPIFCTFHFNPVKHGQVRQVGEWPYSTFHRYVRDGMYPGDWAGAPESAEFDLE